MNTADFCGVASGKYSDAINMELLQLATLMMRNLPSSMATHRKELIKFGWNHLKREESSNKYHAFLNVCHFLEAYQAPEKIVLQASCTQFCVTLLGLGMTRVESSCSKTHCGVKILARSKGTTPS